MTTTRTGDSPSANTPEKAAQISKSVDPKVPDSSAPTNIFSDEELKEAAERSAAKRPPQREEEEEVPAVSEAKRKRREKDQPW